MPNLRAQLTVPMIVAGVGGDLISNTWHFATEGATTRQAAADAAQGWLETFYGVVDAYTPSALMGSPATVKWYDLSEAEPRTPFDENSFTWTATAGSAMPSEVACVLSFHAAYVSGSPKARRRGRIYLGPFLNTINDPPGRFTPGFLNAIGPAAGALLTSSNASALAKWIVYSPTDGQGRNVVGGWLDNAFDIQRRRGLEATTDALFGTGRA